MSEFCHRLRSCNTEPHSRLHYNMTLHDKTQTRTAQHITPTNNNNSQHINTTTTYYNKATWLKGNEINEQEPHISTYMLFKEGGHTFFIFLYQGCHTNLQLVGQHTGLGFYLHRQLTNTIEAMISYEHLLTNFLLYRLFLVGRGVICLYRKAMRLMKTLSTSGGSFLAEPEGGCRNSFLSRPYRVLMVSM